MIKGTLGTNESFLLLSANQSADLLHAFPFKQI